MCAYFSRCFECGMFIGCDYVLYKEWIETFEGNVEQTMKKLLQIRRERGKAPLYDCCQVRLRTCVGTEKQKIKQNTIQQVSYPSLPYKIKPEHPWYQHKENRKLISELAQQRMNGIAEKLILKG